MAEFIAEDPVHVAVASEQPAIYDVKGRMVQPKTRRLFARFQRGAAPQYAIEVALATLDFRKIHQTVGGGEFPRERWFGYYDSRQAQQQNGWTEDEHDRIVGRLRELGYLEVEPKKATPPWPAYDKLVAHGRRTTEMVVQKILERVSEDGYDPAEVAAYEAQNLARPEVLAALTLEVPEEESDPLIAA